MKSNKKLLLAVGVGLAISTLTGCMVTPANYYRPAYVATPSGYVVPVRGYYTTPYYYPVNYYPTNYYYPANYNYRPYYNTYYNGTYYHHRYWGSRYW